MVWNSIAKRIAETSLIGDTCSKKTQILEKTRFLWQFLRTTLHERGLDVELRHVSQLET